MKKLFCLLALIALPAFAAEKAPAPAVLRVGTFNIRVPNDPPPNNWAMRVPRVKALLQKQPLDIIGMQETTAKQLDDLLTLPGWASIGVAREDGIRRGEFSNILFRRDRLEKIGYGTFWLSETPDVPGSISWKSACRRICTWGRFRDRLTGNIFCFVNTHLDHVSQEARTNGLTLIVERMKTICQEGEPVILTGDFNMTYNNPALRQLDAKFLDVRQKEHGGKFLDNTPTYTGFGRQKTDVIIDYIFRTPDLQVIKCGVEADNTKGYPSDHNLVWAELAFPQKKAE